MSSPSRLAAVLGHPISHSLSPVLHQAAYEALGLAEWSYAKHDVTEEALPGFLASLSDEWAGLSLTMPLKQAVIPLLDHVEPLAQVTGAVNTVLFSGRGARRMTVGTNTDVHGIVSAVREGATEVNARSAAVIGAGATASSALAALAELGCTHPVVYVRNLGRTAQLRMAAQRMGVTPSFVPLADAAVKLPSFDVVVSTLPPHAADDLATQMTHLGETPGGVLLDVAYDPAPTALVSAWQKLTGGVGAVTGERMLLHQAVEQVRLMTGLSAPVEAMAGALNRELERRRQNS